jgi:outer membrane protein, multidrug efflux system
VRSALQTNTRVVAAQQGIAAGSGAARRGCCVAVVNSGRVGLAQHGTAGSSSTGSSFKLGAAASWTTDVLDAARAAVDAGQAGVKVSEAGLGDVQVQVTAEVALHYILLRSAQAREVVARDNLASLQETLQITLWRQQAGPLTWLEAEQARAAVEQNRAQLPALQTAIVQTRHALSVLTGPPPAAPPELIAEDKPSALPQAREDLALNIPAQTLRHRADVRDAEFQVAAALARVGQAQARR